MTDAQLFLCVVLFFCFSGRCLWRPARTLAFRSVFFGPYRALIGPSTLGNRSGSLLVSDPFVPLRPTYLVDLPDLVFTPEAIAVVKDEHPVAFPAGLSWTRYDELKSVGRNDRSVTINGSPALRCRSAESAICVVEQLEALRAVSSRERSDQIRAEMKRAFSSSEARRTLRKTSPPLERLRRYANVWLAGILVAYLIGASQFGYAMMTLFLLLALEAAAIHLSFQFRRLHAKLYPEQRRDRTGELIKFLCCSPTVFHCVDAISARLLAHFHPLVVAHLVCAESEFDRSCAQWVRALKFAQPTANESELWFRNESGRLMEEFLRTTGRSTEQYLAAPERLDPTSLSYCPRCQAQFAFGEGDCPDCDIPVTPFAPAPSK